MNELELNNGKRYRFIDKDDVVREGTYERESGNFFCGGDETFIDHHAFFEVASCKKATQQREREE